MVGFVNRTDQVSWQKLEEQGKNPNSRDYFLENMVYSFVISLKFWPLIIDT